LCPLDGGSAVYSALSLLYQLTGELKQPNNCLSSEERAKKPAHPITFELLPNPSSDRALIQTTQDGVLEVFSLTGKLLATYQISEGSSQILLDQFVSGTYLARLTTKSGDVTTHKFVVVK
jgi:Secretion system C-terminal sorting domain